MGIKINCVYNDKGAWCKNKNIKRSLWGMGARCCSVFNGEPFNSLSCSLKEEVPKPRLTFSPQSPKKNVSIHLIIEKEGVNKNDV